MTPTKKARKTADLRIYERQAAMCKAFANPLRLHLLDLLGKDERSCSELQEVLGITKANLSQHVAILRGAGIITTRREGQRVFCMIAVPEVEDACQVLRSVLLRRMQEEAKLAG